ncbi:hypothetical protein DN223_15750, partial [Salmonella enterica subsp. enterica]|nr:hypothetical protein [Salmonella enterica subsp. enterica serovar Telelkebir]
GQTTSLRGDCPKGERSESIPPHRHIQERVRTKVRAFFRITPPVDYRMMAQFTSALSAYREHNTIRLTISRHKKTGR